MRNIANFPQQTLAAKAARARQRRADETLTNIAQNVHFLAAAEAETQRKERERNRFWRRAERFINKSFIQAMQITVYGAVVTGALVAATIYKTDTHDLTANQAYSARLAASFLLGRNFANAANINSDIPAIVTGSIGKLMLDVYSLVGDTARQARAVVAPQQEFVEPPPASPPQAFPLPNPEQRLLPPRPYRTGPRHRDGSIDI